MKINATQKLEVDVDPIEFIIKLQTQIGGKYFSRTSRIHETYFMRCHNTSLSDPWYSMEISEEQYNALQGLEHAKEYLKNNK
jgi:hypothetical protein